MTAPAVEYSTLSASGSEIDLSAVMNSNGVMQQNVRFESPDGNIQLSIENEIRISDGESHAVSHLTAGPMINLPSPENGSLVGLPYSFGPSGVNFSPPAVLTYHCHLPDGVDINEMRLALYNPVDGSWTPVTADVSVDANGVVTFRAEIYHFSEYGVIVYDMHDVFMENIIVTHSGSSVEIAGVVNNTTGSAADYEVRTVLDNTSSRITYLHLEAGKSMPIKLSLPAAAGSHSVNINGIERSFTVPYDQLPAEKPFNYFLVIIIVLSVAAVSGIVLIAVRAIRRIHN
jgi:hypothetical protein